ncbi:MAG: penicillin-binding protein 1A [Proteobacteria bacterium]|nr:penicillin-binding protein 1A [Pseudomonadota bacterium]
MKAFAILLSVVVVLAAAGAGAALYALHYYGRGLPDYQQLADYEPPTMTRIHAGDGRLLAEYAIEQRVFVPIRAMPRRLINAFLAAEDKNFFRHPGVDALSVLRALVSNIANIGTGRRLKGASTITQQVAKNFLLTGEVSIERKVKEAILAFRIERAFSKQRILELYLNEIYLGMGSYGVAAAALNYFNKSLDALTVAETAFLAALPKAPNNYHPVRNAKAAVARRDWVIGRMRDEGHIPAGEAWKAMEEPIVLRTRDPTEFVRADHFTEEVRRRLIRIYGEEALYGGGLSVRTTVDPRLQAFAEQALRDGLIAYDRRHGWRGPLVRIALGIGWAERLAAVEAPPGAGDWRLAVVLGLDAAAAYIGLGDGSPGVVPVEQLTWARKWRKGQRIGPKVKHPSDVVSPGDVVLVEALADEAPAEGAAAAYALRQIPQVNGALVALDPHTSRVLAMAGGYSFAISEFNRATQAMRQPGSAFKPIVYLAALDGGFTPASIVDDAPIVIDQGPHLPKWKPANYTTRFYGRVPLRVGIERSRNLMTVRIARAMGIERVAEYAERLGVVDELPRLLPMALGAGETTLIRLTAAYAAIVNGGKRVEPALIERIQDRHGSTIYRRDTRDCADCLADYWNHQPLPFIPDTSERVLGEDTAYQMVSMLQGVIQRGTGRRIADLGRPLAGKTGTTNDNKDTWFIGFSPDLVAGVFVGFDRPQRLGYKETGSRVAAPVFKRFMAAALADEPVIPFRIPRGVRLVRIDADTGLLPGRNTERVILEAFKPGTEPASSVRAREAASEGVY